MKEIVYFVVEIHHLLLPVTPDVVIGGRAGGIAIELW
jgi:hypothetical protein